MDDLNSDKNNSINLIKSHAEILEIIDEIKELEKKFQDYEIEKINFDEELIEVDDDHIDFVDLDGGEINFIEIDQDKIKQFGLDNNSLVKNKKKPKKRIRLRLFKSKDKDFKEEIKYEIRNPTIIKLRVNDEGKLVNLDLKESTQKSKQSSFLKKISLRRGKKTEEKEPSEKKSKGSKLKGSLGKLGKLKKAIPGKGKKEKTAEAPKE